MTKNIDKSKVNTNRSVKFSNLIFLLGILFWFFLLLYSTYKIYSHTDNTIPIFYILFFICALVFIVLFSLGLKYLSDSIKVNLSVLFITISISLYGFEIFLHLFQIDQKEKIAKKNNVYYDKRNDIQVLDDLKKSFINVFPNTNASQYLESNGFITENGNIFPLGTISNSTTYFGNEAGYWPIIEMDEHGFNNPKGLYKNNNVDIVLIGDSFTEGVAVTYDKSISAFLRNLDFNVINLGKSGNGPLIEFATLKEYAKPIRPKIVLWIYFVNDLENLTMEFKTPILKRYYDEKNFSQNLLLRQDEINSVLKDYALNQWRKKIELEKVSKINYLIKILTLQKIRIILKLEKANIDRSNPKELLKPIFYEILKKSNQMISEWGGKMYFLYLPAFENFYSGLEDKNRDFVLKSAEDLGIPVIDIQKLIFEVHQDPISFFPFRMNGHYTDEGYKLIAEEIEKRLQIDYNF